MHLLRHWGDGFKDQNAPEIWALRQYDVEQITKAMSAILAFAEEQIRFHAVDAIPNLVSGDGDVVTVLLLPYPDDPNPILRWVFCELFPGFPDSRVILPLVKLLEEDVDPNVMFELLQQRHYLEWVMNEPFRRLFMLNIMMEKTLKIELSHTLHAKHSPQSRNEQNLYNVRMLTRAAQLSVHPTGGRLRVFRQFAWLQVGSVKMAYLVPPRWIEPVEITRG